jgi:hypothetical protein
MHITRSPLARSLHVVAQILQVHYRVNNSQSLKSMVFFMMIRTLYLQPIPILPVASYFQVSRLQFMYSETCRKRNLDITETRL